MLKKIALLLALLMLCATPFAAIAAAEPLTTGDLFAFEFSLEGVYYSLPASYQTFSESGWQLKDASDAEIILNPSTYTLGINLVNNANFETKQITVYFFNNDNCVKPLIDCPIAGIKVDKGYGDKPAISMLMEKGIERGISTQDEIIAAFGNPDNLYEGSTYNSLEYAKKSYEYVKFFTYEGVLQDIEIRNFIEAEILSPVSEEVPQYILDYQAPEALGDDVTTFIVSYGGVLYHMPVPVSALIENGFTYKGAYVDSVAAKDSPYGGVQLNYNNETKTYYVRNYADVAVLPENCAVYSFRAANDNDVELILPGGIMRGMAREELEKLIGSVGFERSDYNDGKQFRYYYRDDNRNTIEIYVTKDTDVVTSIEISAR